MRIVFHGDNATSFSTGFDQMVGAGHDVHVLPDDLAAEADRECYAGADVIVANKFDETLPRPEKLRLFHVPAAGYDGVKLDLLPPAVTVCNCFGHEQAIAEYVLSALLARHVPLADADARLRRGDWKYWAGKLDRLHDEMAGKTMGLLGFGHIGKALAVRAKAFEMRVSVANRSAVPVGDMVDQSFTLDRLGDFWGSADYIIVSVPLLVETTGLVSDAAFAAMRPDAVIVNVGRGATIDEKALYAALKSRRIGGAIIDTWYQYPTAADPKPQPSKLPFNELSNVIMTPHMSGWTPGTIRRRQKTIADNIRRRSADAPCVNVVRQGR